MQYLPNTNIPCISYDELIPEIMSADNFRQMKVRGKLKVSCTGGNGRVILIEVEHMPKKYRDMVVAKYGDPRKYIATEPLKALVKRDDAARAWYAGYVLPCGDMLPVDYQMKYAAQCDWFGAIAKGLTDKQSLKDLLQISVKQFWENMVLLAKQDKVAGLPTSVDRFEIRYRLWRDKGYEGIVEAWRFGNDFRRKVTGDIRALLEALNDRDHGPYQSDVFKDYNSFMRCELHIVHLETGEAFEPKDFVVEGKDFDLSLSTVKHYLSKKGAKMQRDKKLMSALEFNNTHRPHMMRNGPFFAFSKCTMDDTSSPFKMYNGDRPATYKLFDVASEALVALVMHKEKKADTALIRRMIMQFVGLIAVKGWKMPHELEMERALTSSMVGTEELMDVFYNGAVFPYIRWCKAKNPQEKRAEGFINRIKNGYHRHRLGFQKRPFNKLAVNRKNEDLEDVLYSFDEIEKFEREDMHNWNNTLHSDQETYPGLTRWQVLEQCQNPALGPMNLSLVMPYVGYKVKTSVNRMRLEVQYNKYNVPDTAVLDELNDRSVIAYYLPNDAGEIDSVYVYQDGRFVCEAKKELRFQEAKIEQTHDDLVIMGKQQQYVKGFDNRVDEKRNAIMPVGVVKVDRAAAIKKATNTPMEIVGTEQLGGANDDKDDYSELLPVETLGGRANRMF